MTILKRLCELDRCIDTMTLYFKHQHVLGYHSIYECTRDFEEMEHFNKAKRERDDIIKQVLWGGEYENIALSVRDLQTNTCHSLLRKEDIELVSFNEKKGVTVVKWKDGTVTKVKVQKDKGDTWNPELGLSMCLVKKMCGNKGNYNEIFNEFLPKE